MRANVSDLDPLIRVIHKSLLDEISGLWLNEARDFVLAIQYFLIKHSCVLIFKRQVPTEQSEQDHPTTPDIHAQPCVLLPSDHLRRCVAWRPTRSLELFIRLIGITEAEVDYLDTLLRLVE